jgi:hypothetical protein
MYFCPECNNVFDITKSVEQGGGNKMFDESSESMSLSEKTTSNMNGGVDIDALVDKLMADKEITSEELKDVSLDMLTKNVEYKKLKSKDKEYVYNKLQDLLPKEEKKIIKEETVAKKIEKAYFICNNCGFTKPIEEGTLIFSRVSSDISQNYSGSELSDMRYSSILPRTRKYICPNKECESHIDPAKREAVFFRLNNTYKVKYICITCGEKF